MIVKHEPHLPGVGSEQGDIEHALRDSLAGGIVVRVDHIFWCLRRMAESTD